MHSGQLADPLHPITQQIRTFSGKRDKTEADLAEMARLEWYGSLYLQDGEPCIPGEILEAHFIESAKKRKKGVRARAGLMCEGNFPLLYEGPREPEVLWKNPRFRFTTSVRVQRNRIMRTRPIFHEWAPIFTVTYNESLLNQTDIVEMLQIGGEQVGLGDWRPRFGRYMIEE